MRRCGEKKKRSGSKTKNVSAVGEGPAVEDRRPKIGSIGL